MIRVSAARGVNIENQTKYTDLDGFIICMALQSFCCISLYDMAMPTRINILQRITPRIRIPLHLLRVIRIEPQVSDMMNRLASGSYCRASEL